MEITTLATVALSSLLPQLPTIGVMIAGLIIAIVRWQEHPRVSALLVIALSLQIASSIITPLITTLLIANDTSTSQRGILFAVVGLSNGLLHAVLIGLMLWAAFGWRNPTHER